MKRAITIQVLILVMFTATTGWAEMVSVKGSNVNLRTEPTTNSTVKWEYGYGFPLKIIEKRGEWAKVQDFEKDGGWIHRSLITPAPYIIVSSFKNSNRSVNIRKGPSTKTSVVGKAYYGVVFQVVEHKDDWIQIRHESGLTGWIYKKLVWGLE